MRVPLGSGLLFRAGGSWPRTSAVSCHPGRSRSGPRSRRSWALPGGDYAVTVGGRLVASVERRSLVDLISSLTGGRSPGYGPGPVPPGEP